MDMKEVPSAWPKDMLFDLRGDDMDLDLEAVKRLNGLAGRIRPLDLMMDLMARYGHWAFLIYGLLLWFAPGERKAERRLCCVVTFAAVCAASLISFAVGKLWNRPRPFVKDWKVWNFTGHKANASFPSNHTMNGAVVAMQLLRMHMPGSGLMTVLAGLLAFSRMFAGVHYPTDLLGGITIAGLVHTVMNAAPVKGLLVPAASLCSCLSDWLFRNRGK